MKFNTFTHCLNQVTHEAWRVSPNVCHSNKAFFPKLSGNNAVLLYSILFFQFAFATA